MNSLFPYLSRRTPLFLISASFRTFSNALFRCPNTKGQVIQTTEILVNHGEFAERQNEKQPGFTDEIGDGLAILVNRTTQKSAVELRGSPEVPYNYDDMIDEGRPHSGKASDAVGRACGVDEGFDHSAIVVKLFHIGLRSGTPGRTRQNALDLGEPIE